MNLVHIYAICCISELEFGEEIEPKRIYLKITLKIVLLSLFEKEKKWEKKLFPSCTKAACDIKFHSDSKDRIISQTPVITWDTLGY